MLTMGPAEEEEVTKTSDVISLRETPGPVVSIV